MALCFKDGPLDDTVRPKRRDVDIEPQVAPWQRRELDIGPQYSKVSLDSAPLCKLPATPTWKSSECIRDPFSFATIQRVTHNEVHTQNYDSLSEPSGFTFPDDNETSDPASDTGNDFNEARLVFLRGHIPRRWLDRISQETGFLPTDLLRHANTTDQNLFADIQHERWDSLFLRLRLTTIHCRDRPLLPAQVDRHRQAEKAHVYKHRRVLDAGEKVGESIIRRFVVHNETIFTVQQDVSCFVRNRGRKWTGLIWTDDGRSLPDQLKSFARVEDTMDTPSGKHHGLPVARCPLPTKNTALPRKTQLYELGLDACTSNSTVDTEKHTTKEPFLYGSSLDRAALIADPMYALSEIFGFALRSEMQFLNLMSHLIDESAALHATNLQSSHSGILHAKRLLDEHLDFYQGTLTELRSRRDQDPHQQIAIESQREIMATRRKLERDLEWLIARISCLSVRCMDISVLLSNHTSLEEARRLSEEAKTSARQSREVRKLTTLAFIFLPITFTSSFFSMNVVEFEQARLPLWVTCSVIFALVAASFSFYYADHLFRQLKSRKEKAMSSSNL